MNYNSADHFYKVRMDGSHGNSNDTLYLYNHTAVVIRTLVPFDRFNSSGWK